MLSPRRILLWCALALHGANALNPAAAYEAVYAYDAYKAEWATTTANPALRTIATGCTHPPQNPNIPATSPAGVIEAAFLASTVAAGLVGICSFDDFIRHVGNGGWKTLAANPGGISISLNPDADAISARIQGPRLGPRRLLLQAHLLLTDAELTPIASRRADGTFITDTNGNKIAPYNSIIGKLSTAIQTARFSIFSGVGPADLINALVANSIRCLSTVSHFRLGDNSRFQVPALQALASWTSSPMSAHAVINTVPFHDMAGNPVTITIRDFVTNVVTTRTDFQQIDYTASFDAASAAGAPLSDAQKAALLSDNEHYGTGVPAGFTGTPEEAAALRAAKVHRDVMDSVRTSAALHQTPFVLPIIPEPEAGCASGCCVVM